MILNQQNLKIYHHKTKQLNIKAHEDNTRLICPATSGGSIWSDPSITIYYHRINMEFILAKDSVTQVIDIHYEFYLEEPMLPLPL